MWRPVHPDRSLLHLFFIASLCYAVYAQSGTDGHCGTCPEECIGRRYWWTTLWGFIFTLVVLTLDVWGQMKSQWKSTILSVFGTLCLSALNPLPIVWWSLEQTLKGIAMWRNLGKVLGDDMVASLWPWNKSYIKIILGSSVIVNLSPEVYEEVHNFNAFQGGVVEKDLSEALVIGIEVEDSSQYNVELMGRRELALLRSNVLPPYDQLKFLRGNSSLGMAIAATQAIGYIYGVAVRCGQGLQVSPIEAIACVLNIVVLIKVVLYNFASLGHRPLLLYLLPEQEAKFIEECKTTMTYQFEIGREFKVGLLIKYVTLLAMGLYFVINSVKSLNRLCIAPLIIFNVSLVLAGIVGILSVDDNREQYPFLKHTLLEITILLLNIIGYIWALIVTFKYWKVEEFDVQSSNYFSQVLPYIG